MSYKTLILRYDRKILDKAIVLFVEKFVILHPKMVCCEHT